MSPPRRRSKEKYKRRSRSRSRDRRRHERERSRSRSRERIIRRHRSRSPRNRSRSPRYRSRSRNRSFEDQRSRERSKERKANKSLGSYPASSTKTDQNLSDLSTEEKEMMKMMGFCNFDSTKGKKVDGNDVGEVHVILKRKYRQYMNRKGGFNRPLDFVA